MLLSWYLMLKMHVHCSTVVFTVVFMIEVYSSNLESA